ncbi:aldehyde dehydrogenase family protein [Pseudonocardia sp. RS010]|uniref:aldehyde dehydrogenase family protein n=1 Tax=Pseudonocardia sp. RS010 TaxID=3385979 RepID=UPI0039A34ECA
MTIQEADINLLPDPAPLVGGERLTSTSGGVHQHVYPATGKPTVEVPMAGPADVDRAISTARAATESWRRTGPDTRRRLMNDLARALVARADELAALQIVENGTPQTVAASFPHMIADHLEYAAGWCDKIVGEVNPVWPVPGFDYSILEPYGVVAIIIPWNSPLYSIGSIIAPALAAGNCVVVKPPELTPFTSLRFAEIALEVGFPPGVISILPGGGEAGSSLVAHPGVDKIHFTGSGPTAQRIIQAASANLTPVALELGGKSANVVFADADLDAAAERAVGFSLQLSGQGCINGTRALVQDAVFDEVVELCRRKAEALKPGDPHSADTAIGPVITNTACERIMGFIDRAVAEQQARLVTGGTRLSGEFADGYYIAPTVFADVPADSEIAVHEIFGPVLSILRFTDEEDAIRIANSTRYGLASYVQTGDVARAHRMASALDAGMVWINGSGGLPPSVPFGGIKQSGQGRLGGKQGIAEFSRTKNVWIGM